MAADKIILIRQFCVIQCLQFLVENHTQFEDAHVTLDRRRHHTALFRRLKLKTSKSRLAVILSLAITSQYFSCSAQGQPLLNRSQQPIEKKTDSDSPADGCISSSESAKNSSTISETANKIARWQIAKNLLENLSDMKPSEIFEAFGIPEGNKRATFGIIYLRKGQQLRFSHYQLEFTQTNNYTDSQLRKRVYDPPGTTYKN